MNNKNLLFDYVYITNKNNIKREIFELTEDHKTKFSFNDQDLYVVGHGHDFLYGYFIKFLTKTGIEARRYILGLWVIDGENYEYIENSFVKCPKLEKNVNNISDINLPIIKKIFSETVSKNLISITPKY